MRMPNVSAEHDDVNGHSSGSEHGIDEELGIPSIRTPGVRRLHAENRAPNSNAKPRRSGRNKLTCFEEAAENDKWQDAMNEEMDALYKAKLVAKGYAQTYGIDYEETFAPVAKMAIVRAVIAVVATKDWILHQMDVKNAFLLGDLQEELYMEQPPDADHSLYVQKTMAGIVTITIYLDDLTIGADALKDVENFKALLRKQFDMKDLGELRYFLGIEMIRNEGGIWLSQKKYGLDMLMKYGMADCKPISTPLDQSLKLRIDEGEVLDDATMYRRIVGSLISDKRAATRA
ncbi:hypothetical protein L7F22_013637 [Adiantum nelumboides]|nr:hypothetical protein [Adiantum nelumboides]